MLLYIRYMLATALMVFAVSCSSSEEQGGEQDGYESQEGDDEYAEEGQGQEGNDYAENGEGNDYAENGEGNDYAENEGGNEYGDGENVNNAEGDEYGEDFSGEEGGEALNNAPIEDEADQMVNDILGANASAGQSANELPVNDAAAPSGNGIVKYAPNPVSLLDQPNGSVIGQLEQGDHPLVYEEGEFSRLFDGRYVGANDLSRQGIGRPRSPGMWQ